MPRLHEFVRRSAAPACAALLLALALAGGASAQTWPARPVTLIVASAAGAGVDGFARMLADRLAARVGQPVIVDNRPGASGMIAAGFAAKAPANGHTLFLLTETQLIAPYVLSKQATTVNVITEFTPVIMAVSTVLVLAVNPKTGVSSVPELVALAKREPGMPWTGGLNGSPMHVLGEQFKKAAGMDLVFVPFKGVGQAITAALGGYVNVIWMPASGNLGLFKSGSLRVLASASPKRSPLLPDVPTMIELGYKDIEATSWIGLLAPLHTPAGVVAAINREVNAVLTEPDLRERLAQSGNTPEGGEPQALAAQMRDHDRRYRRLAAELKITAD